MDARFRIFLYTLTSQYQNQSFSARALLTNPSRCPETNRIRVDGRIRFVYATCGRRYYFLYPHKKNLRIQKSPDTCGWSLSFNSKHYKTRLDYETSPRIKFKAEIRADKGRN